MNNEYYGAPTRPNDDFLAHYGVLGMKWGVRKAKPYYTASTAKLERKLAKLQKRANNGKKYAKRAALLGAGAAAAGGLAAAGTEGVAKGMAVGGRYIKKGMQGVGGAMGKVGNAMAARGIRGGGRLAAAGKAVSSAGSSVRSSVGNAANAVNLWGRQNTLGQGIQRTAGAVAGKVGAGKGAMFNTVARDKARAATQGIAGMSNNTLARIGAAGIGAGLAVGAGYNAYRAATTKRAARKAEQIRAELNRRNASGGSAPRHSGKKKNRR